MTIYGGRQLADAFRGVRANAMRIAGTRFPRTIRVPPSGGREDGGRAARPHCLCDGMADRGPRRPRRSTSTSRCTALGGTCASEEQALRSKAAIIAALRERGEQFATFLEGVSDELLAETVTFPPPVKPSERSPIRDAAGNQGARDAPSRAADDLRAPPADDPAPHAPAAWRTPPPPRRLAEGRYRGVCSSSIRMTRPSGLACFRPWELPGRVSTAVPGVTSKLLPSMVMTPRPLRTIFRLPSVRDPRCRPRFLARASEHEPQVGCVGEEQ